MKQKSLKGEKTSKDWIDVGRPWELIEVNEELIGKLKTEIKGTVEAGAVIHGEVFLDEGSVIKAGVYIEGNVYIGKNCDIGPNSYIRGNTYFGDNVHVGNAVEIKNSIIMENTNVSHLSYVGDSVIGSNCNIAAGTNIANLRFDNATIKTKIKNQKIDSYNNNRSCYINCCSCSFSQIRQKVVDQSFFVLFITRMRFLMLFTHLHIFL